MRERVASRYAITETNDGFRVEGRDCTPVQVAFADTHIVLPPSASHVADEQDGTDPWWFGRVGRELLGFYQLNQLVNGITKRLLCYWLPPDCAQWPGVRECTPFSTERVTARVLCRRIHAQWKRLCAKVSPNVLAVHRAMYAAAGGPFYKYNTLIPALECGSLYRDPHLMNDIAKYRAAAVAAVHLDRWAPDHEVTDSAIELLKEWRGLYLPTGKSYRNLNITLDNLPGGVSHADVPLLRWMHLERPLVKRLELAVNLAYLSILRWGKHDQRHACDMHVLQHATESRIRLAMQRVCDYTHWELRPRKTWFIRHFVAFLVDCPETHKGGIVGWADRSIRWHRHRLNEYARRIFTEHPAEKQTARPPLALPDIDGIKFLATVGDIRAEHEMMGHCIANYVEPALGGRCFLFHAEHKGELATVELAPHGQVVQAVGPRNQPNNAAKWAGRVLGRWGHGLPKPREYSEAAEHVEIPF